MSDDQPPLDDEARYRIGAVCRMTGLSQHVLRVWEKRYGVVRPRRASNQRRLYSERDIDKLALLKRLVDAGHAIGSIAQLDRAELDRRLQQSREFTPSAAARKPRVLLLGQSLSRLGVACGASERLDYLGLYAEPAAIDTAEAGARADVAVVEWPSLHPDAGVDAARLANRLGVGQLVLVYDYAPGAALARLAGDRIVALRAPLDLATLESVLARRFAPARDDDPDSSLPPAPPRRYDDRTLAFLATYSTSVACECPQHLVQLITSLARFEAYSAECESRNPADAELHALLYATASRARERMEQALARVIEHEGLPSAPPA